MKILLLGGTVFLGRHIVSAALARGHELVLFNRGRHNPDLFPGLEKLRGDRNSDLALLRGRTFDAVIDPSGYTPEHLRAVIDALGQDIPHYTFISSVSVYRRFPPGQTIGEEAEVAEGDAGYGALKARSEEALLAALPGRAACVRAGLIVGPFDPTNRFSYWPRRVAAGGHVLAPGRPERPVQFIDARDLAQWCVQLAETRRAGVFNAVGPDPLTMSELLVACRKESGSDATFVWLGDEVLLAAKVSPWTELPLWIPEADENFGGMLLADNARARAAGLTFRPIADTIRATLDWDRLEGNQVPPSPIRATSLTHQREQELLTDAKVAGQ